MRHIRRDVTIGENGLACGECRVQLRLGFQAIAGVKQRRKMGIDGWKSAKLAVEKTSDQTSEECLVAREADDLARDTPRGQRAVQEASLSTLARAIDALDGNQFSGLGHWVHEFTLAPEASQGLCGGI